MSRSSFGSRLQRNATARHLEIGRILRLARKNLKLRQAWVGEALGYGESSQAEVCRIEAGKRKIDVVELENFSRLYGIQLKDFETWDMQHDRDNAKFMHIPGHGPGVAEGLDENEFQQ